jgi:hypothetical protein
MTDQKAPADDGGLFNPTLHAQAHGQTGRALNHLHIKAAEHHEEAARHHREAARAHEGGNAEQASVHATRAFGHGAHAQDHATDALKGYAAPPG